MRARNLKPSLFRNELLAVTDPLNTLIFEGLWCLADREGRLEDRPAKIHLEVNPGRAFEGTERALAWLAENGFIERYGAADKRFIQVVNFIKHQNPHVKEAPSTIPAPGEHGASTGLAGLIPDSPSLIPDSPSLIPKEPVPQERDGTGIESVFMHWKTVHGHPRAQLDAKRRKVIRAALANYTVDELCEAISGYLNSPHHMGVNERGTRYDDIEVFLRDAKHIDAGLAFGRDPPANVSTLTRKNVAAVEDWVPPEVRNAVQ